VLTADQREGLAAAAVALCREVEYVNAGTVEFVYDNASGEYYFIEMNTRIQVEHPVTEMVTGADLVMEQLRVAMGAALTVRRRPRLVGHAIEFRINAEDPETFAPSPGTITELALPGGPGVRVDTHVFGGYRVPPYYDSLIAKLIVHGRDRGEAIRRAKRALRMFLVRGIATSIPLHLRILEDRDFLTGDVSTSFMERFLQRS